MAARELKPVLTGQRLKARKRDVKEKFDAVAFRDELVEGLSDADDWEKASKFLETNTKLDYRTYADALFDILIAGGLLAPGGSIVADGAPLNKFAALEIDDDFDEQKHAAELIRAIVRRYKYLQVSLEESYGKILQFLAGFSETNVLKLAQSTAFLLAMNLITAKPLLKILQLSKVVDSGLALDFITKVFQTWLKAGKTVAQVASSLRKGGVDHDKILQFFPGNSRNTATVNAHFSDTEGLAGLGQWYIAQQTAQVKKELEYNITVMLKEGVTQQELIEKTRAVQVENRIPESQIAKLIWPALMAAVEWNKKPEIVIEQALRHVKGNISFLGSFTKSDRAQVVLMVTMQEHAFVNQTFLKIYSRFCLLFYKADMLGEDAILEWYAKAHSQKGKTAFLTEMKPFITWLNTAEEESEGEDAGETAGK
eukprot:m.194614 g.194614  ORF g.194614 m.194614 type:complete len:425 (+) comp18653_c0_seq1:182-1456(+)